MHPTNCNGLTENRQDISSGRENTKNIVKVREKSSDVKMFSQTIINKRLKDLTNNRKKAYMMIFTWIKSLSIIFKNWHNRLRFPTGRKTKFGQTFIVKLCKNRRKLWRTHLDDNSWNSVGASGFGCIKIVDCTRNHFGIDILRAKSLFSTRWKMKELLGTIINGGIA